MTLRYSEKLRNAGLDARIAAIGPSPRLHIFGTGAKPLVVMLLPKDWMLKAANGMARKTGAWVGIAEQGGKAQRFEICDSSGERCVSGDIADTKNSDAIGDMTLNNTSIENGQSVMVGAFVIAAGNG